jgi:hypothetical protein
MLSLVCFDSYMKNALCIIHVAFFFRVLPGVYPDLVSCQDAAPAESGFPAV